ncbi:MAG: DUF1553 domain-containing protein, partial [Phycisphaeraceae bacterium]
SQRDAKRDEHAKLLAEAKKEIDNRPPPESRKAYAVTDKPKGEIGDAHVHVAGNQHRKGARAPRGFLSVITPEQPEIPGDQSGRLQLAEWLVSEENPLTPRVMVNRIWHWHFGKGIVATTDNFGLQGEKPTHPELLDYLASRFVESGWSFKAMHREIMLSDAYRRASVTNSANVAEDPSNDMLWRYERRRLEAEAIRDGVLLVSGRLDLSEPKEHPFGSVKEHERFTQHNPFLANFDKYEHDHRSVYLMTQRLQKHPILGLFDGPNRNQPTGVRRVSTVPLQSLFMMNSGFIRRNAESFAETLLAMEASDRERINVAFERAMARPATDDELADGLAFVDEVQAELGDMDEQARERQAWSSFARVLLSSSEFVYVD